MLVVLQTWAERRRGEKMTLLIMLLLLLLLMRLRQACSAGSSGSCGCGGPSGRAGRDAGGFVILDVRREGGDSVGRSSGMD